MTLKIIYLFIYLFWLHRVLVASRGIFTAACGILLVAACGLLLVAACELLVAACMRDLVP